jgi:hypothetical protein
MSLFINNNSGPIYNDCTVTIHNGQTVVEAQKKDAPQAEDIVPVPVQYPSCLFTKKVQQEQKKDEIIQALQHAMARRQDKARALVEEVRKWQKEGYLDSNYNARVMYDELNQILTLPFQYGGFRKYYN